MPAARPTAAFDIAAYDVVGTDSATSAEFVRHVGLAQQAVRAHAPATSLTAAHMRPPLEAAGGATVNTHGAVPLSVNEQQSVERFINDLELEYTSSQIRPERQYCVHPHTDRPTSDGTVRVRRFSCVGFVVEAYRDAGLEVVTTEDAALPPVSLATLLLAYPDQARWLTSSRARERVCNLPGDGPWPLLLPGHLLAALDADEGRLRTRPPYRPVDGDEFFPSRRTQPPATASHAR